MTGVREIERERNRHREIFHMLIHFPNAHNREGWTRLPIQEAGTQSEPPTLAGIDPNI